jgi:hypothetical protein
MNLRGATNHGDVLEDSHSILNRWKNYFSHLLNVHNVSDVRQIEVHMVEPLVPGPSRLEVEIAIAKLKKCKSPSSDQIPEKLIQAGGEIHNYCLRSTNSLILIGIRNNCLISGKCYYCTNSTKRVTKLTVIIIVDITAINIIQNFIGNPPLKVKSVCR